MNKLPTIVSKLVHCCNAWVCGSAADPNKENPRDFDIVVPYSMWQHAASYIPKNAKPNSFGGWKFLDEASNGTAFEVDVWPGEMDYLMRQAAAKWFWKPDLNIRWKKEP